MKKEIETCITYLYKNDFEGDVDEVIEYLKEIKKDHLKNYKYLKINIYSNMDGNMSIDLIGIRDETDEEYQTRIQVTNDIVKNTEERERKLLETLKLKYETN